MIKWEQYPVAEYEIIFKMQLIHFWRWRASHVTESHKNENFSVVTIKASGGRFEININGNVELGYFESYYLCQIISRGTTCILHLYKLI